MNILDVRSLLTASLLSGLLAGSAFAEALYDKLDPSSLQPRFDARGESEPTLTPEYLRKHDKVYKSETLEATLHPQSEMEFMTTIDQGEVLLYAWETSEPLYFDFHGHQHDGNPDVWTRFAEGKSAAEQGSMVTPYTGEHGWYWVNIGTRPVKIRLTVTGYYNTVFRINLSGKSE